MNSREGAMASLAVLALSAAIGGAGEQRPAPSGVPDPRVGLKAGFRDGGSAALNIEHVASIPKPEGFFDPKAPQGSSVPPEPPEIEEGKPPPPPNPALLRALSFFTSDMTFRDHHLFAGSFHGFNIYDIETARHPRLVASVVCPGGQGDVSVYRNLLFVSVEELRGRIDCGGQGVEETASASRFRGVRIFDMSTLTRPRQVAAVQTCRGSHTHTLIAPQNDNANVYLYASGVGKVRPEEELAGCSDRKPEEDANTALFSIDVIQVPLAAPGDARIVNRPRIFADPATGAIAGLWAGGNHGPGTQKTAATDQCHDITVFVELGLAVGACAGNGILMDISDPVHPVRLDQVVDKNFAYWHSATFNNDGTKVIMTDEWGGGLRPRCRAADPVTWGADAIFDIVDRKLRFAAYYKLPAPQSEQENCVAHNGSLIPVPGRDIMVQGWYQGGVSVFDFTDSSHPTEIAFFDRGPIDGSELYAGGYWSAYWYNGHIYASELARGVDVFRLKPSQYLSQNEITAATLVQWDQLNVQGQTRVVWQPSSAVARAYLDQLARTKSILPERAAAVRAAFDRADRSGSGRDKNGTRSIEQLEALAGQVERDAATASGRDAARLRSLAATIKGRAARLR